MVARSIVLRIVLLFNTIQCNIMKSKITLNNSPHDTTLHHTTQREYYNLVKEGNIREALITMGVERAKDVSQANQLMNLRKVSTALPLFFSICDDLNKL